VRLSWARRHVVVPEVLGAGDGWLHTAGLPGRSAVDPWWLARPCDAARAIGSGLRSLHDALPVNDCPFDWSVTARLAQLPARRRTGLGDAPPVDRLVVCHGDACAPNTLIEDDGTCQWARRPRRSRRCRPVGRPRSRDPVAGLELRIWPLDGGAARRVRRG
jgi:kanamycin kinase